MNYSSHAPSYLWFCGGMLFERLCNLLVPSFKRAYMRFMEEAYSANPVPRIDLCSCGQIIKQVHGADGKPWQYWRNANTGEVCVDNHWHSPKE